MQNKRGQMKLSFGMIFSILLIIVFVVFAFYGIGKFMNFQKEIKYKQFEEDFQANIDKLWKGSFGSNEVEYYLPSEIRSICFIDDEFGNLEFKSTKQKRSRKELNLNHLDIEKTLGDSNALCIENIDNKVKFKIEKNYGEALVTISKI